LTPVACTRAAGAGRGKTTTSSITVEERLQATATRVPLYNADT
jgi:hypothetical protein